ncbi:M56 family metallopeptidase [Longimicrobium sp.]|uniref:M56 family metallopeptidase n=1 Tax=Longimicrobium sp. TaxID=2029185 RepID=UPI002E37D140|nr:M56 family metallopeptidase [Longimicrobium sp.]HEX6039090.1 M56 family metallopeptidase [Longimicrobium sp.]
MDLSLPAHAAAPWLAPALWLVARGTVLLVLAAVAVLALRRASAAARHMAWALALTGMLALPVLSLAAPRWELPWVHVVSMGAPAFASGDAPLGAGRGTPWGAVVLAAWAVGAALTLGRYAVAVWTVHRIAARAQTVTDGPWMARMRDAATVLGMREPVRLLRAEGAAMPMTWGVLRPVVLIPADADSWSAERARVVLLHEVGHVARRDCLWQTVARLACAAYWFHPGVWWAARQMHVEREQACDDQVLAAGTRASDYAGHLLEVARTFRTRPLTAAAAVAMARRSQLEDRVVAVLDAARARGRVTGRVAVLGGGVAAVALFPLAAASPGRTESRPAAEPLAAVLEHEASASAPALEYSVDAAPSTRAGTVSVPLAASRGLHLNVRVPDAAAVDARRAADQPYPEPFPEVAMNDEVTLAALMRATHDADPEVRRSAVWALGRMDGGGVVVGSLVRSMQDSDARVRSAAALALGEYAERQETARIAARRPGADDSLRVPTGSAPAMGRAPTAARTDIAPTKDPALHLRGAMEEDTLAARGPL